MKANQKTAPTPEAFQEYVDQALADALEHVTGMAAAGQAAGTLTTDLENALLDVAATVSEIVEQRGAKYGEDVLWVLGESGFVVMAMSKMLRLFWSFQNGLSFEDRRDSWVDMIGYGALCLAYRNFEQAKQDQNANQVAMDV